MNELKFFKKKFLKKNKIIIFMKEWKVKIKNKTKK